MAATATRPLIASHQREAPSFKLPISVWATSPLPSQVREDDARQATLTQGCKYVKINPGVHAGRRESDVAAVDLDQLYGYENILGAILDRALHRHDPALSPRTRAARPPVDVIVHGGRWRSAHRLAR